MSPLSLPDFNARLFEKKGINTTNKSSLHLMAKKSRVTPIKNRENRSPTGFVLTGLLILMSGISAMLYADESMPGKSLVMEKSKGNCLACHAIADGKLAGNIGPPLIGMKARFPDPEILRRQIWDASERNPDSRMPPFGRHGLLSRQEIDQIVEYLYTL